MKNRLDGGEALLEAFRSLGVEFIVSSPGSEWAPLWEAMARRDRFWTGVVYFRERRWNEALAEFNRARSGERDEPLQWYLRRLEPLANDASFRGEWRAARRDATASRWARNAAA